VVDSFAVSITLMPARPVPLEEVDDLKKSAGRWLPAAARSWTC
jgi:hypothetical protein